MWTITFFLVLGIIAGIIICIQDFDFLFEPVIGGIMGGLVGILIGLVVALCLPSKMIEEKSTLKLVNMQDGSQTGGNFFLGCGNIESKMKYIFYYEQNSTTFAMEQIDYDKAQIKYTSDSSAYIETYIIVDDSNYFWNNLSFDTDYGDCRYIIYVPEGTIKNNYNLDAQ